MQIVKLKYSNQVFVFLFVNNLTVDQNKDILIKVFILILIRERSSALSTIKNLLVFIKM